MIAHHYCKHSRWTCTHRESPLRPQRHSNIDFHLSLTGLVHTSDLQPSAIFTYLPTGDTLLLDGMGIARWISVQHVWLKGLTSLLHINSAGHCRKPTCDALFFCYILLGLHHLTFSNLSTIVPSFLPVGMLLSIKQQWRLCSKDSCCFTGTSAFWVQLKTLLLSRQYMWSKQLDHDHVCLAL